MENIIIKSVAVVLCVIAISIAAACSYSNYLFVKGGYTHGSLPGLGGSYWVKPGETNAPAR
jgi:hypothetical protein